MLSALFPKHTLLLQRPFCRTSPKCNILETIISTFSLVCWTHTILSSFPPQSVQQLKLHIFAFQRGTLTWVLEFWSFPSRGEAAAALRLLLSSCTASNTQWRQVRPWLVFRKFILKPGSLFYEVVTFCIDRKCDAKSLFLFQEALRFVIKCKPSARPSAILLRQLSDWEIHTLGSKMTDISEPHFLRT